MHLKYSLNFKAVTRDPIWYALICGAAAFHLHSLLSQRNRLLVLGCGHWHGNALFAYVPAEEM